MRARETQVRWPDGESAEAVELLDEGEGIRATVVPRGGGEIASLKVWWRGRWLEMLYRALQFEESESGWRGRAPLLWPAVGRNYVPSDLAQVQQLGKDLPSCSYQVGDRVYRMPIHGFVRDLPWDLDGFGEGEERAWVTCRLSSGRDTRKMYPFEFDLAVTHALTKNCITSRVVVTAGRNAEPMFFSIGNHITLNFPFAGRGRFEDGVICSPTDRYAEMSAESMFTGRRLRKDLTRGARLSDPDLCNIVMCDYAREGAFVELVDPRSFGIRVSQREIARDGRFRVDEDHIYFVLYGKPEEGYFCPEPWLGGPNSLNTREGVALLTAGEEFEWEMKVQICRPESEEPMQRSGE